MADGIAPFVAPVFAAAGTGQPISFLEANLGALSYALQLYFDFSGYSDMAIGLSRMFGIILPLNFNSPYKAQNIIEFWRRWHMTLSRFLRDYLYIPLGGNRLGSLRRHANLLATMLLGGLWHGAGWTFVIWGALHGALLVANHAWHALRRYAGWKTPSENPLARLLGTALTFYMVVVAWVFFRADTVPAALNLIKGMLGFNGLRLPSSWQAYFPGGETRLNAVFAAPEAFVGPLPLNWLPWLLTIVWLLPNTQEFMSKYRPALKVVPSSLDAPLATWRPHTCWAIVLSLFAAVAVMKISTVSEFLYFQF